MSETPYLKLYKPSVNDDVNIHLSLTDNFNKVDQESKRISDLLTTLTQRLASLESGVILPPTGDTTPPIVTILPVGGTFTGSQSVTLSTNEQATIYYTLDGSTPTIASSVYSNPIAISTTTTLKYFARDTAGNSSSVQTVVYTISVPPSNIRSLSVTAHQDESIVGFTPDLLYDVRSEASGVVIEVYLTAGDAGDGWGTYAQNREKGARAAYANMAGVANDWTMGTVTFSGKTVASATLNGTNIKHIYLRLPDGSYSGGGFSGTGYIGMYDVWQGTKNTITSLDRATSFTKDELIAFVTSIIDTYSINTLRHFIHTNSLGDGEHYDHWVAGRLANESVKVANVLPTTVVAYRVGSSLMEGNKLKTEEELTATQLAVSAYALYDSASPFNSSLTNWKNDSTLVNKTEVVWRLPYTPIIDTPTVDTTPPVVTASPLGGTYTGNQTITLSANEQATIYYTLDGSTPTTSSSVYSNPIPISATTTLKYFGKDTAGNSSTVVIQTYTINQGLIVLNTFTKPDKPNANLSDMTADTGQVPVLLTSTWAFENGKIYENNDGAGLILYESSVSDVDISVDISFMNSNRYGGLVLRAKDASNFLAVRWFTDYTIQLDKWINGVYGELTWKGSYPLTDTPSTVRAIAVGTTIKLYVNNVLIQTITETNFATATKHGIRGKNNNSGSDRYDNLVIKAYSADNVPS